MRQFERPNRILGKGLKIGADLQFVYDKFAMMPIMQSLMKSFPRTPYHARVPVCRPPLWAERLSYPRVAK